jgi:tRNA uridine 5-carboxymethylaminomethyl modification enzyme
MAALETTRSQVQALTLTPNEAKAQGLAVNADGKRRTASELLAYPDIAWSDLAPIWPELDGIAPDIVEQIEIDALYAGYIDRQQADILAFRRDEAVRLPRDLDYRSVGGLSNEAREKLERARPETLGQASRIEGVTPGALTAVLAHVKRLSKEAS